MAKALTRISAIIYAPPKVGKTVGMIKAFPLSLFLGPSTGLKSAAFLGLDIDKQIKECTNVTEVREAIEQYGDKFPSIAVDDFTIVCDWTYAQLREKHKNSSNKYKVPDEFGTQVYDLIRVIDKAPCDVVLSMHEQGPKSVVRGPEGGEKIPGIMKGGPMLPGWQWPEKLPGLVDFITRVTYDDTFQGWPYVYQTGPDPTYVTGDRLDVTPVRFPQNLGEILRAYGKVVNRPTGLGWMESAVEKISEQIIERSAQEGWDLKAFLQEKKANLSPRVSDPKHIRWALLDALDRANLKRVRANMLDAFIDSMSGNSAASI